MHPTNPNTLFAASYQRRRQPWGFNGGGPGSGIWRTDDAGKTWTRVTERSSHQPDPRPHRAELQPIQAKRHLRAARGGTERRSGRRDQRGRHDRPARSGPGRWRRRWWSRTGTCCSGPEQERGLEIRRRRQVVEVRQQQQQPPDVLQQYPRRSDQPRDRVHDRRERLQVRRRRQDIQHDGWPEPRRSPRALDQPAQRPAPRHRQRRRARPQLRPGRDVGRDQPLGARPVLRDQRGHAEAVLRVRRAAGQRLVVRTERRAQHRRHHERRLVSRRRRRRLLHRERSARLDDRLLGVPGRQHQPLRPAHRRHAIDPAITALCCGASASHGGIRAAGSRRRSWRRGAGRDCARRPRRAGGRRRQHRASPAGGHHLPLLLEHAVPPLAPRSEHGVPGRRSALQIDDARRYVDGVAGSDEEHR